MSQREVGTDTDSFPAALRSALREDRDVLLLGEMRGREGKSRQIRNVIWPMSRRVGSASAGATRPERGLRRFAPGRALR